MDFDSVTLTRVLAACSGESGGPEETVLLLRQQQPSFAPTMFAVWQREGQPLNPALRYELDLQRDRIERYRELAAIIAEKVPDAVSLKGLQVAGLYPPDVVRYMNDLDYVVPDQTALWRLGCLLVELDWAVESATFVTCQRELHIMVAFRQPNEDRYALPYGVEIATHVTLGDLSGVPPVIALPAAWQVPEVKNLVMLLFERFEQRYRARDLVDASIQFDALGRDRFPLLAKEIQRLGLWPEYAELRGLLSRAEIGDLPAPPRRAAALSRGRRVGRVVTPFARPTSAVAKELQRRMVRGSLGRVDRRAWALVEGKLSPGWALRAGLLCFGLPVDGGPTDMDTASVHERDGVCWVETPIGRFVLTPGNEIAEDALESLPVDASGDTSADASVDAAEHAG